MAGIAKRAVVPAEATMLSIAIFLTLSRMIFRLGLQRTRLTPSDWLLVASIVDAIALFTTDTMTYNLGGMDDVEPPQNVVPLMKIAFAGNYFYDTGVYFPKLALLAFYYRLVPHTKPKLRRFLHFTTGMTLCFMITTFFIDTFFCGKDVSVNWDPNGTCSSFDSMTITRVDWTLNVTADMCTFSIPFFLLPGLQVNKKYMVGLVVTFSLGLITLCTSIVRFATVSAIHAWTNVYVLSMAEMAAAIVVVCLPALKSLILRGHELSTSNHGDKASTHPSSYKKYGTGTSHSHIKLSSGRDDYGIGTTNTVSGEDSGSEVELQNMHHQPNAIYKAQHFTVTSEQRDDMA